MINSMTGFGRGEASAQGISVNTEIKTVNSRYLNFSFHLPSILQDKELELKQKIKEQLNRGKINVYIRLDKSDTGEPDITFNKNLLKGYRDMLEDMQKTAEINGVLDLGTLLSFDDLFESREEDSETVSLIWELTQEATSASLHKLTDMRRQEGQQLKIDLIKRIDHIEEMLNIILKKTEGNAKQTKAQLLERIQDLIENDLVDDDRLEMEVALLVDKKDITEELVRTQSHIKFFREAILNDDAVGRRLNFLSQEINREINTIGSKANDSEISQHVVQAKESLEQIREQVQNIE